MTEHKSAEELYSALTQEAAPVNPLEAINREVDEMYRIFKKEIDIDTVITKSEFDKYSALYSADMQRRAAERDLSVDEINHLAELSQEFYHRVNVRRPVHIVDDYTQEEIFTLPPVFNTLHPIRNDKASIIDAYRTYNDPAMLRDNNNPIVEQKRNAIDKLMYESIVESQPVEELKKNMAEFESLATDFHRKMLGNDPLHPDRPVSQNEVNTVIEEQAKQAPSSQNTEYDDDFDF